MINQILEDQPSAETLSDGEALYLLTAGGRVRCLRCTALSKRTGVQCGRPASKFSKTQKCHMHGGRGNSAPRTEEGRQRLA